MTPHIYNIKIVAKRSHLHGNGGFSTEFIPKGRLFDIPVEPHGYREINYSSDPNSAPTGIGQSREGFADIALRDIHMGDEITFPPYGLGLLNDQKSFRRALDAAGFWNVPTSLDKAIEKGARTYLDLAHTHD